MRDSRDERLYEWNCHFGAQMPVESFLNCCLKFFYTDGHNTFRMIRQFYCNIFDEKNFNKTKDLAEKTKMYSIWKGNDMKEDINGDYKQTNHLFEWKEFRYWDVCFSVAIQLNTCHKITQFSKDVSLQRTSLTESFCFRLFDNLFPFRFICWFLCNRINKNMRKWIYCNFMKGNHKSFYNIGIIRSMSDDRKLIHRSMSLFIRTGFPSDWQCSED